MHTLEHFSFTVVTRSAYCRASTALIWRKAAQLVQGLGSTCTIGAVSKTLRSSSMYW